MYPALYSWAVPQCPFSVEYAAATLDQIRLAAVEAFFAIPRGGLEIGGVLLGRYRQGRLLIQDYRLLDCDHAAGPSFTLSEKDKVRLHHLLAAASAQGLSPVGWFRSRTRSEISLSESDVALYDTYFPEPWQVALVLRPHVTRPVRAGFFFRGEGGLRTESSYGEFLLEAAVASEPPAVASEPPAGPKPIVEPTPEPAPQPAVYPDLKFLSAAPASRSFSRALPFLAVCLALGAAGVAAGKYWPTKEPESFSFEALDRNGQLQLAWDRTARPIREARRAKLEITDGAASIAADLGAGQLRQGSFYYARQTERVDVHMTVFEPDGRASDRYVSFLGRLPARESEP